MASEKRSVKATPNRLYLSSYNFYDLYREG
jgi:hypothetical protein